MKKCYNCNIDLNRENLSKEHIIPNSLGGVLSCDTLLCKKCNNEFGNTLDVELYNQLKALPILLGIDLDRGSHFNKSIALKSEIKSVEVGPKLLPLSKLIFTTPSGKKVEKFHHPGKPFSKAKRVLKKNLEKKWLLEDREYEESNRDITFHIPLGIDDSKLGEVKIGGKNYLRAIARICLNYYLSQGFDSVWCEEILRFIKGETDYHNNYCYYYPTNLPLHFLGKNEVSHIIHLKGDNYFKLLYVYIELFNLENYIFVLNRNYEGTSISTTYAYDIMLKRKLDKRIAIKLGRHHFDILNLISKEGKHVHNNLLHRIEKIIEEQQKP